MIGCGVPRGASTPNQLVASKPGTPDSATVGKSGMARERVLLVMASALTRPLLICGIPLTTLTRVTGTSPATTAPKAAEPLYGTCVNCVPVTLRNHSIDKCASEPLPGVL